MPIARNVQHLVAKLPYKSQCICHAIISCVSLCQGERCVYEVVVGMLALAPELIASAMSHDT